MVNTFRYHFILSFIYTGDFFACDFLTKMNVAKLHIFSNGSHCDKTYLTTVSSCFHSDSDTLNLFEAKSELISLRFFIATPILLRGNLHSIRFSPFSSVFLQFCFSVNKYVLFNPHFYMSISALTKLSHTG